jgi:hypothetical protein
MYLNRTKEKITSSKTMLLVEIEQSGPYLFSINFETAYSKIRTHYNIFMGIKSMQWVYLPIYNIIAYLL